MLAIGHRVSYPAGARPTPSSRGTVLIEHGRFATTRWSMVLTAADETSPGSADALGELCKTYWYPIYAFVRRQGCAHERAQDLTQEFFARFLAKNYLRSVNANLGRLVPEEDPEALVSLLLEFIGAAALRD